MNNGYRIIKRIIDILLAYFLLFLLYPLMLIIALCIKLYDGEYVIFKQRRVGLDGKPFVCYKFRTMRIDAPSNLSTTEFKDASSYITPIGAFLRKTSLDELPQLINVLCGQMSLIGPRPLILNEREMHKIRMDHGAYSLRPGITGLAQICGRDELDDRRKILCDIIYTQGVSFKTDAYILFLTVGKVINGEGIKCKKNKS